MSMQSDIDELRRNLDEIVQRLDQFTAVLPVLDATIEAGSVRVTRVSEWVKETSDQTMRLQKEIVDIHKEHREELAQLEQLLKVVEEAVDRSFDTQERIGTLQQSVDELEGSSSWNEKEEIKVEIMRELARLFATSAKVCREASADATRATPHAELATVLACISEAMQNRSKGANQAPEPAPTAVTPPARPEARQP
jgi:chromosome segregation ATPase